MINWSALDSRRGGGGVTMLRNEVHFSQHLLNFFSDSLCPHELTHRLCADSVPRSQVVTQSLHHHSAEIAQFSPGCSYLDVHIRACSCQRGGVCISELGYIASHPET
jgi:hypothetical protein